MTTAPQDQSLTLESLGRAELLVLVRHCIRSGALKGDREELARAMWTALKERADRQREIWRAAAQKSDAAAQAADAAMDARDASAGRGGVAFVEALSAARAAHGKTQTEWKILQRYECAAERALTQWRLEQKGQAA